MEYDVIMITKNKKNSSTMYEKVDKVIGKLDDLCSDVIDGTVSANSIYDRIEKIRTDLTKIQDLL